MGMKSLLMVMVATSTCCSGVLAAGDGGIASWGPRLQADAPEGWLSASRMQGRLGLSTQEAFPGAAVDSSRIESVSLMGDYYFSISRGLRATGGVILGSRPTFWAAQPSYGAHGTTSALAAERRNFSLAAGGDLYGDNGLSSAMPYLGVGYTGVLSSTRSGAARTGGWGFTADLGLLAQNPRSGVRLGSAGSTQQNFDDFLRDLKLAPTVQLGVSYTF